MTGRIEVFQNTLKGKIWQAVMSAQKPPAGDKPPLRDFLLSGPCFDDDIVDLLNQRSRDTGREVVLDPDPPQSAASTRRVAKRRVR
jgi:hypothetical protein